MNITSITPSVVHFVQTDEYELGGYIRLGEGNWMISIGNTYESTRFDYEEKLESEFQKEVTKTSGLILQRRLKHPFADGSMRNWHDHPGMAFGPLPKLSDSLKEKLSAPGGEYLYRAIRRHEEVVWEGGGE